MDYKINPNPNSDLSQFPVSAPRDIFVPEGFQGSAREFQQAIMRYNCAIREVKTKLEVLNDDLSVRNSRPRGRSSQGTSKGTRPSATDAQHERRSRPPAALPADGGLKAVEGQSLRKGE